MWGTLDILKALDSTTSSGTALIPQIIDPYIAELALKVAPLRTLIPRVPWKSGTYDRNKRTAFGASRFVGDANTLAESNSAITRFQEPLKIIQSKGGVTGFLQASSQELLDAYKLEVNGATVSSTYTEEYGQVWGNRFADDKQFNGLDTWVQTNVTDQAGVTIAFTMLDTPIDQILRRGGRPQVILMSHAMQSKLSATLLTNQQRFLDKVEIKGGMRLLSYRDIPIYPTTFLQGNQAWTGGVVASSTAGTGGTITAGTYRYKVAAVLTTGETLPAAEVTQVVGAGTTNTITLTWSAPSPANSVNLYKIYRTTGAVDSEVLYTVIPAVTYLTTSDLIGTLSITDVTTWVDTGLRTSQTAPGGGFTVTGANYIPTKADKVLGTDEENIFVISTDVPGVEGYATHMAVLKELGYMPLAKIADKEWFLVLSYSVLIMIEQFSAQLRRVKTT